MENISPIEYTPADYNGYRAVHVVGDIHGCFTVLKEGLGELKEDELYIFAGDFLDRGTENAEVLKFLVEIRDRKNCHFIEGNHEANLRAYGDSRQTRGNEFNYQTLPQIQSVSRKDVRMFCRRLRQCEYFVFHDRRYLICHGGIPGFPPLGIAAVPTSSMIRGVGLYEDMEEVAASWNRRMPADFIQIFGHRNTHLLPPAIHPNVICLEGKVESGGCLRIADITASGLTVREIRNDVFNPAFGLGVPLLVQELRKNRYIDEKQFGGISSFNFTRTAFDKGIWDEQTVTARGLFVDVAAGKIVARGYRKFFNIGEREETTMAALEKTMKFPAVAYVKENGFLGLASLHNGELFATSKSNPYADYAGYFRETLTDCCRDPEYVKDYLSKNDVTLVFECIDIVRDPHIIRYDQSKVVLLDIIENNLDYSHRPLTEVREVAAKAGFQCKTKAFEFGSWLEFSDWYRRMQSESLDPKESHIEGYVIEDSDGFMAKVKLPYYSLWKHMRTVAALALNRTPLKGQLSRRDERFYNWVKDKVDKGLDRVNIIELRDEYFAQTGDRLEK